MKVRYLSWLVLVFAACSLASGIDLRHRALGVIKPVQTHSLTIDVPDNITVGFPTNAPMEAIVALDGLTNGTSIEWNYFDSTGVVTFTSTNTFQTTGSWSTVGTYNILVTGRKGKFFGTNSFKVFVLDTGITPPPDPLPEPPTNNIPPVVFFTTPTNGVSFESPVTFTVEATASDTDGQVVNVTLYDNGTAFDTNTIAPFTASLTPGLGTHILSAVAIDNGGLAVTNSVSFSVVLPPAPNILPVTAITAPLNGAVYTTGDTVNITASASDSDGTIAGVAFYHGTTLIGVDATSPYAASIANIQRGNYTLTTVATDNDGAIKTSAAINISVVDPATPLNVDPGPAFVVTLPALGQLTNAVVTGNGVLSVLWSKVSGPGTVTFGNAAFTNTTATFSLAGSYILRLTAATATETNSAPVTVTVLPAVPPVQFPTNQMPIEIIGPSGTTETLTFGLTNINPAATYQLYVRIHHTPHDTNAFKIAVNSGAFMNINDATVTVAAREKAFGGLFGACSVIRFTMPLTAGKVANGINTIQFAQTHTNANTALTSIRVLDCNVQTNGTDMIASTLFTSENPNTWQPPINTAAAISTGSTLWHQRNLLHDNGVALIASCSDCHAEDGRDLKYFNYSNKAIIERSKFHGLNQLQGEQIASYIRSLQVPNPGRPWNPPYQPGPGLDTNILSSWAAGAGIGAVLDDDQTTIADVFGSVVTNVVVTMTNNCNARETRICMQLPDWNHWLPQIHPLDAYGSAAFVAAGSKMLTSYDGSTDGAPVGSQYLRNTLVPGSAASLSNSRFILASWVLEQTDSGSPFQVSIAPKSSVGTLEPGRKRYAAALWQAVKMWELHQKYQLEDLAGANVTRPNYVALYDAEYAASFASYDNLANSSSGQALYSTIHQMQATLSMWEATSNITYLTRCLTWAETIISKATIVDINGKKNFPGTWASPYSPTLIAFELEEYQGMTELSRLCRIIWTTPSLVSYRTRATAIYNHIRDHVVNKILITRGGTTAFVTFLARTGGAPTSPTLGGMNDKPALMIRNLLNLSTCSIAMANGDNATYGWATTVASWASGMKDHFGSSTNRWTPYAGGLVWDLGFGLENGYTAMDTDHANRIPAAIIELYKAGIVFDKSYINGITRLFNQQMWDKSFSAPQWVNFIDGQNGTFRTYGAFQNGAVTYGWNWLAEWDATTFAALSALGTYLATGVTGNRNDNQYFRIGLHAELARCATRLKNGGGLFELAAEPRTQFSKRLYFDLSPNILGLGLTSHSINNNTLQTHRYFSIAWYNVQLIIDSGNHSPNIFYQTSESPVDWAYALNLLKDLQNATPTLSLGGLFTLWHIKQLQATARTFGPSKWRTGGWNPLTVNPDILVFSDFDALFAGTPIATRKLITEAILRNWLFENQRWAVSEYYTGTSPLTSATYVPYDNRDGVTWGNNIVSSFIPRSGKYYWRNLGNNTGVAIDATLLTAIKAWAATIWPLGWKATVSGTVQPWSAL